jgi:type II secretory pathway component PulF
MPSYRYQSIDRGGAVAAGTLVAPDRASAMRQLQAKGLTPLALDAEGGDAPAPAPRARPAAQDARQATDGERRTAAGFDVGAMLNELRGTRPGRPGLKRTELANIIRELATAIEAGLPLLNAL